jgi:beta-lactamase regulating signal transducer with metallopeptidase domain/biopolymer transport protein ExbD
MIDLLNECGQIWIERFGLVVVQNTLFLGLVFAALYWLRNSSAWVRHVIALAGLAKLITPPFLPLSSSTAPAYFELPRLAAIPYQSISATTDVAASNSLSLTLAGLLFTIWCAVTIGVFAHALVTTIGLRITLRHADEASDDDLRAWSLSTGIAVRITDRVPVPMTIGVFPRTIFVPPHWTDWSTAGRCAVLRHEMAHIRRRDGIVRALETLARALYWFHPLVPLLTHRIGAYREQLCDETAAAPEPNGRLVYSRLLVEIAEHLMHRPRVRSSASTLMRRRNELLDRVRYLTQKEGTTMRMSKTRAAALTGALAIAIASLSWYHGTATPPPSSQKDLTNVEVSLGSDGQVTIDGKKAKLEKLGAYLKQEIGDENAVVHIVCEDNVPMSTLFQMHAVLRATGMYKVSYRGLDGERMPLVLPSEKLIQKTKSIPPKDIVHLAVAPGGKCTLDGMKLKPSMIRKAVEKRLSENDKLIVSLEMAGDATFAQYAETLRALKAAQANRIFINEPGTL